MLDRISDGVSCIAVCVVGSFKGGDDSGCEAHGMLANSRWRSKGRNPLPQCRSGDKTALQGGGGEHRCYWW